MYNVHQHWDPLKVCMVGRSYSPEFYRFIQNSRVRTVMERIAQETEEDYQSLIKLLESFNVKIIRPEVSNNYEDYIVNNLIEPPPMTPRDYSAMIGNTFHFTYSHLDPESRWCELRGASWPENIPTTAAEYNQLPQFIKNEISNFGYGLTDIVPVRKQIWNKLVDELPCNKSINTKINAACTTRIGKDLYFGTTDPRDNQIDLHNHYSKLFPEYRCHVINTIGHSDGVFCPVVPGLIVSLKDIPTYKDTFPGWEVVYLPGQSWGKVAEFIKLKKRNQGKWWVPGEELNSDFTEFVESWLSHWVGYVEETVFDVNMLVIDEKNVVCNNYNKQVFGAFERFGITPHIINFRHRYFWDGGLHCITSDLHREGVLTDYFPERG